MGLVCKIMEKCDFSVKFATSKKDKTDTAKDVKLEGDCKVLSARSVREAMGGISDLKMIVLSLGITYLVSDFFKTFYIYSKWTKFIE